MEPKELQKLAIERDVVVAVLQYLQTRPWAEVNGLIAGLLRAEGIGGEAAVQEPQEAPKSSKQKD